MTANTTPSVSTSHRPARGGLAPRAPQLTPPSPSAIVLAISTALRCLHAKRLPAGPPPCTDCAPAPAPVAERFNPHTIAH